MAFLKWKPEFSVGVAAVDHEHREMIEMINDFYLMAGEQIDSHMLGDFLGDIHNGISAHFALEESLMQNAAYPEYERHKADHEELLDRIRELMDRYNDDPVAGGEKLRAELSEWFASHFSTFDARLHGVL
jgi:hemerythrin-like metal-binding protein